MRTPAAEYLIRQRLAASHEAQGIEIALDRTRALQILLRRQRHR